MLHPISIQLFFFNWFVGLRVDYSVYMRSCLLHHTPIQSSILIEILFNYWTALFIVFDIKRRRDFLCGFFSSLLHSALLFYLQRTESIHPDWRYTRNNNSIKKKIIVKHKLFAKYFKWMLYHKYFFEYSPIRISLTFLRYMKRTRDN